MEVDYFTSSNLLLLIVVLDGRQPVAVQSNGVDLELSPSRSSELLPNLHCQQSIHVETLANTSIEWNEHLKVLSWKISFIATTSFSLET